MKRISASVGARGRNRKSDVETVQRLLNEWRQDLSLSRPLAVTGVADGDTIKAIVDFQDRVVGMLEPDGRVDLGGRTLARLHAPPLRLTQLPDSGRGFYTYTSDRKRHGTAKTLASVGRATRDMETLGLEVGVGNISLKHGGKMPPHRSHQRGVDVDFRPLRQDGHRRPVTIDASAYSRDATAELVRALRRDANLELILFNDDTIPGTKAYPGHHNHLHVRFKS